jgi:hypothetical protein
MEAVSSMLRLEVPPPPKLFLGIDVIHLSVQKKEIDLGLPRK